jgi:hypothetical protein
MSSFGDSHRTVPAFPFYCASGGAMENELECARAPEGARRGRPPRLSPPPNSVRETTEGRSEDGEGEILCLHDTVSYFTCGDVARPLTAYAF